MNEFDARLLDGPHLFVRNMVTLALIDRREGAYLMADGTWKVSAEGTTPEGEIGITLPAASVEAIARAIQEWQGHTSHADTEARILREWLSVERERVERVLSR